MSSLDLSTQLLSKSRVAVYSRDRSAPGVVVGEGRKYCRLTVVRGGASRQVHPPAVIRGGAALNADAVLSFAQLHKWWGGCEHAGRFSRSVPSRAPCTSCSVVAQHFPAQMLGQPQRTAPQCLSQQRCDCSCDQPRPGCRGSSLSCQASAEGPFPPPLGPLSCLPPRGPLPVLLYPVLLLHLSFRSCRSKRGVGEGRTGWGGQGPGEGQDWGRIPRLPSISYMPSWTRQSYLKPHGLLPAT